VTTEHSNERRLSRKPSLGSLGHQRSSSFVSVKNLARVRTSSALTDRARLALCGITPVSPPRETSTSPSPRSLRSFLALCRDPRLAATSSTVVYDRPRSRSVRDVLDAIQELSPRFDRLAMFESDAGAPIEFLAADIDEFVPA
jgi:hypothetical protein